MTRFSARLVLLLSVSLIQTFEASARQDYGMLQLGTTLNQAIHTGQQHRFSVALEENQLFHLVVDERGIDVVVRVYSPAHQLILEIDNPDDAEDPEVVRVVAPAAGTYTVEITPVIQD